MLIVRIDEHSFNYLQQGLPIQAAFYTDNDDHLPWYQRKSMIVYIGKNLDLDAHEKTFKDKEPHQAIIDHTYLFQSIQNIRAKLINVLRKELLQLGVSPENLNHPPVIENIPAAIVPVEIKPEINSPEDRGHKVSLEESAKLLRISKKQVVYYAGKGLLQGWKDQYGLDWQFEKEDLISILKSKPKFLKKAWRQKKFHESKKLIIVKRKKYIRLTDAMPILKLSYLTLLRYIKSGQLKTIQNERSHYIHKTYLDKIIKDPPDWLKKSWIYFNNPKSRQNE